MATSTTATNSTLTTETDLSLLYRVLRTVIKPLRPRLTQPGKPLPAGSPRLEKHPKSKKSCTITERRDEQTRLWLYHVRPQSSDDVSARKSSTKSKHKILYFAGGGFQSPPSGEHWSFVSTLASHSALAELYDFTIVSYPLAPNSPAADSLPVLRKYLRYVLEKASLDGNKVTLMGDSAGGNVALSLGFWWVQQLKHLPPEISVSSPSDDEEDVTVVGDGRRSKDSQPQTVTSLLSSNQNISTVLANVISISPAVDMTNSNPDIKSVDPYDPILGSELTGRCAKAWTGVSPSTKNKIEATDPQVSPLLHDNSAFAALNAAGIKVHGIIGTHDTLGPDAELFRQKCVQNEVKGDWLIWEGQMHCFVLAGIYGMKEGKKGIEWLSGVLQRNV